MNYAQFQRAPRAVGLPRGTSRPIVLARNRHGRSVRVAFVHAELMEWIKRRIAMARGEGMP
jgi:hypothetical protein